METRNRYFSGVWKPSVANFSANYVNHAKRFRHARSSRTLHTFVFFLNYSCSVFTRGRLKRHVKKDETKQNSAVQVMFRLYDKKTD